MVIVFMYNMHKAIYAFFPHRVRKHRTGEVGQCPVLILIQAFSFAPLVSNRGFLLDVV